MKIYTAAGIEKRSNATPNVVLSRGASWFGGSGAIVVPINDVPIIIPADCTIQKVALLTQGGPGSCVVDIWKLPYGSYPPTVANSICAAAKPTIAAGIKYLDTVLTGWTKSLLADDTLMFHLETCTNFTQIALSLYLKLN